MTQGQTTRQGNIILDLRNNEITIGLMYVTVSRAEKLINIGTDGGLISAQ